MPDLNTQRMQIILCHHAETTEQPENDVLTEAGLIQAQGLGRLAAFHGLLMLNPDGGQRTLDICYSKQQQSILTAGHMARAALKWSRQPFNGRKLGVRLRGSASLDSLRLGKITPADF